jgi:hypothetical protein
VEAHDVAKSGNEFCSLQLFLELSVKWFVKRLARFDLQVKPSLYKNVIFKGRW